MTLSKKEIIKNVTKGLIVSSYACSLYSTINEWEEERNNTKRHNGPLL